MCVLDVMLVWYVSNTAYRGLGRTRCPETLILEITFFEHERFHDVDDRLPSYHIRLSLGQKVSSYSPVSSICPRDLLFMDVSAPVLDGGVLVVNTGAVKHNILYWRLRSWLISRAWWSLPFSLAPQTHFSWITFLLRNNYVGRVSVGDGDKIISLVLGLFASHPAFVIYMQGIRFSSTK